jgi:2-haloalkanoic acid dehalogenase type II
MAELRLNDFDAVTFDIYGTLIDWEPSITAFFRSWADRNGLAVSDEQLMQAYDRIRSEVQKERPAPLYPEVLRRSFERVSAAFNVAVDPGARAAFGASAHHWPPYADSAAALKALQLRAKVGALSNIDEASLATSCRKLGFTFDVVVTAERVGAYKPDWPHFHTAIADLAAMGIPMQRILHVGQSLRADMVPATKLGLKCVWVNRPGRRLGLAGEGVSEARPDLIVSSLKELVATLGLSQVAA